MTTKIALAFLGAALTSFAGPRAFLFTGATSPAVVSVNPSTKTFSSQTLLPAGSAFFAANSAGSVIYSASQSGVFSATNAATSAVTYSTALSIAGTVVGMALSPAAATAYVATSSQVIAVNTTNGAAVATLTLPQASQLGAPAVTKDGATIVSLLQDYGLVLIDSATFSTKTIPYSAAGAFALDSRGQVFIQAGTAAELVSLASAKAVKTFTGLPANYAAPLVAASDGSAFYYIGPDQSVVAVAASTGKSTVITVSNYATGNYYPAPALALSSDNSTLYFLGPPQALLETIDTTTLQGTASMGVPFSTSRMAQGPNSNLLLFATLSKTGIASLPSGSLEASFFNSAGWGS